MNTPEESLDELGKELSLLEESLASLNPLLDAFVKCERKEYGFVKLKGAWRLLVGDRQDELQPLTESKIHERLEFASVASQVIEYFSIKIRNDREKVSREALASSVTIRKLRLGPLFGGEKSE